MPTCRSLLLCTLAVLLPGSAALARRYPITSSDASGSWIGSRQGLLHGTGELWKRYGRGSGLPADEIADLELDARSVWVATPAGLARLDKGSRRWEVFLPPQLPSADVRAVSVDPSDPDSVWVGTGRGLAHYNVRTNTWRPFLPTSGGLPAAGVNDVLYRGQTVWAATDAGLAAYDRKLGTWTVFTRQQGLSSDRVLEIDEQGADLWLTGEVGVSRMSLQRRTFFGFRTQDGFPAGRLLSMARVQNLIYFATESGLITYDTAADTLSPFLHGKGLQGGSVRSVIAAGGFLWFATDRGLARFEPTRRVWEHYRVEDGLSSERLGAITAAGNLLLVFGERGEVDTYDYKKDEWMVRSGLSGPADETASSQPASQPAAAASRPAAGGEAGPRPLKLSVSAELNTELKQDFRFARREDEPRLQPAEREGYWLVNTLRLGAGAQWGTGRSLDFSGNLDWGDISPVFEGSGATLRSFQRYDVQLRYLGSQRDWLREAILSDKLRLEPAHQGGQLVERTEAEGGRVVAALGPARGGERFATIQAAAGIRRGTPHKVVLRRPAVGSLQIKRFNLTTRRSDGSPREARYIIPASVRAVLDGKELERNVDYFVDHENGVLWIKNTDLVHAMGVLEVEFEVEQIPRKNVGAVSMTDLLPRDGDIGKLRRSGMSRWAKDEQGLFDEIDGGAEQYINRGWSNTLSQDFEWGSAGIILRIHDMGEEKNAESILLARKLPDAKPVPGLEEVYLEKQAASLSIKLTRGQFFIEVSIDQATLEQEILSIAGWLVGKLTVSGATTATALREVVAAASTTLRLGEDARVALGYLGTRSIGDETVHREYGATGAVRDILALSGAFSRRLGQAVTIGADVQAAASSAAEDGADRRGGSALEGSARLQSPRLTLRAGARKYSEEYAGIGTARQTEFCRTADGRCTRPGTTRLDYEVGADAGVRGVAWLPVTLTWQHQVARLGEDYPDVPDRRPWIPSPYPDAPRPRLGVRDIAMGQVSLDRQALPKITVGGGYLHREDTLADSGQLRGSGSLEADLAETWLRRLRFKKIYLRGLYEYGQTQIDELRALRAEEQDRSESMHHAVGELRLAPTHTESAYSTLEYHGLQGARDGAGGLVDQLTYWRLDAGAGSSIVPGLALRFDSTLWFGDDQPLTGLDPLGRSLDVERKQEVDSTLSGVIDLFPGEWLKRLSPLKLNAAYTYTRQAAASGLRRGGATAALLARERCDNGVDDDGDGQADCDDSKCALDDACLIRTGDLRSQRVYGTAYWDTPGKLQAEVFADLRWSHSGEEGTRRAARQEVRSYLTWRPVYSSPLTLRFDVQHETKRPEQYDALADPVEPEVTVYEPALEWRRRWSVRWWHLAKLTVSHSRTRDLPHVRTLEDAHGRKGDLERLDYNDVALKPSVEIRRRFEDERGKWSFRPYLRASYKLQWGSGVRSRIDDRVNVAGDAGLADGSETSRTLAVSLGVIWVHSEHLFVDLDLTTSHVDCVRAPTGSLCNDRVIFTPHLLATARY